MHAISGAFKFYVAVGAAGAFTVFFIKALRLAIDNIKTITDPCLAGTAMFFVVIAVLMLCMKR